MRAAIRPLSAVHHDLTSFLAYARRTGLDPSSTVFVGSRYEYLTLASLARIGLSLERTGGKSDKGIDLLGNWSLPSLTDNLTLRVLVQCKALTKKLNPSHVRELEGAFSGVPIVWKGIRETREEEGNIQHERPVQDRGPATLAMLVTPTQTTKGVRDAMGRSRLPMSFAKINLDGVIEQLLWNKSAADLGLEGMVVGTRYRKADARLDGNDSPDSTFVEEVVLTWRGRIWDHP